MSMTLRLTDDQDAVLVALAADMGVSKQEAVVRAIAAEAARRGQGREVRTLAARICVEDAELLARLAQ